MSATGGEMGWNWWTAHVRVLALAAKMLDWFIVFLPSAFPVCGFLVVLVYCLFFTVCISCVLCWFGGVCFYCLHFLCVVLVRRCLFLLSAFRLHCWFIAFLYIYIFFFTVCISCVLCWVAIFIVCIFSAWVLSCVS